MAKVIARRKFLTQDESVHIEADPHKVQQYLCSMYNRATNGPLVTPIGNHCIRVELKYREQVESRLRRLHCGYSSYDYSEDGKYATFSINPITMYFL